MNTNHSPLPWLADGHTINGPWPNGQKTYRELIATTANATSNKEANAALIIRAVNSHYQLVEALEALVEIAEPDNRGDNEEHDKAYDKAVAALALAKKGQV